MTSFIRLLTFILTLSCLSPSAQAQNLDKLAQGGAGGWLNTTRPLTVEDMQGRLVLLDFWTYGCINCMQVIPDLEALEKMFGNQLLVIGVHSAKFEGEKGNDRILDAAKRFGLEHPVINDSDYAIWKSYKVTAWPTLILLAPDGRELERFIGEGHLEKMKTAIAKAAPKVTNTTPLTGVVSHKASTGTLSYPARLAASADGIIYIADSGHHRILGVDDTGKIRLTIGNGTNGLKDGTYNQAQFNLPRGLVVVDDHLYVADTNNHAIRKIDLKKQTVQTVAGNGKKGDVASPWDLDLMEDQRTLAVAMAGRHQLMALNTRSDNLSVLAGNGAEDIKDDRASRAELAQPSGISNEGNKVFFVDAESSALRVLEDGNIRTLIGTGLFNFGKEDGIYPTAKLQHPQGLAAAQDAIYIADTYNNAIRVYDRATSTLSTLALPDGSSLNEPGDVLLIGRKLWIADTNNHAIKVYDLDAQTLTDVALNP